MKRIKYLITLIFISFVITTIYSAVYAEEETKSNINSNNLYSETNTFNYLLNDDVATQTHNFNNDARYDMSKRNDNIVSNDEPMITVLTHGWNGNAKTWSEKAGSDKNSETQFGYNEDSLITKIITELYYNDINRVDIYVAKIYDKDDIIQEKYYDYGFYLKKITKEYYEDSNIIYNNPKNSDLITDISKHIIIVFEGLNTGLGHDYIYTQFNYMMSEVVLQVKNLNNGVLPRINLIGHSRGGITNMQYALDHPDMVASLYSFGTPYLGTTVAELDINNADGSVGELLLGDGALGEKDLANPEIYMKLVNRWNNNYDNLYSRIRCMALGGKTSISYLSEFIKYGLRTILEEIVSDYLDVLGEDAYNEFIYLIISLADEIALAIIRGVTDVLFPALILKFEELIRPLLSKMDPETSAKWAKFLDNLDNLIYGVIDIISSEIKINLFTNESTIVWESDVVVNIESQLASRVINGNLVSYKGFSSHCVTFTPSKEEIVDGITHVKEVYNKKLQEYLIRDLKPLHDWGYYKLDDNNICITGYYGEYPEQGVLDIPSELSVNGKIYTVASIGEYAFADDCYGMGISTYIIPSTVTEIGDYAFENCISMKFLNTANATSLKKIGTGCFSITDDSLSSQIIGIRLPNNIEEIGSHAFANNVSLKTISIPNTVLFIGEGVFSSTSISNIQLNGNENFTWTNEVLLVNNVSDVNRKEVIYANPNLQVISIPDGVSSIAPYTFKNNKNLKGIYLNKVETIGEGAFSNSGLEEIFEGEMLENVNYSSFINTPWLSNYNSTKLLIIGNVLLQYNGTEEVVIIPEGIKRVGENAFNDSTTKIIYLSESMGSIGYGAFKGASSLEKIYFKSSIPPIVNDNIVNEGVSIIIPHSFYDYYINNIPFEQYIPQMEIEEININYYLEDGTLVGNSEEYYGSYFDNFYIPDKIGYDFSRFLTINGEIINKYDLLYLNDDSSLIIIYETSNYILELNLDNDNTETSVNYGESLSLDNPVKEGYQFNGWYDKYEGGNLIIDSNGQIAWDLLYDDIVLYAQFSPINYGIIYDLDGGESFDELDYIFNVDEPILLYEIDVRKYGYIFAYWINTETNEKIETTDEMYQNITIMAVWFGDEISYLNQNIKNKYAIIDIRGMSETQDIWYYIYQDVNYVTFIGNPNKNYIMDIWVYSRTEPLVIGFENVHFQAKSSTRGGRSAINANWEFPLYISYKGDVKITGGRGGDGILPNDPLAQAIDNENGKAGENGNNGYNGGNGIEAYKVTFQNYDSSSYITVVGGRGGDGAEGQIGQQGSDGVNPPRGNLAYQIKGDDGADGGVGGNGGNGGNGGYAVMVEDIYSLRVPSHETYKFKGGDGGNGGKGGQGGAGGRGASDTNGISMFGLGTPGNGGDGGTGGTGGNGGTGSIATNALYVYGEGGTGGEAGIGGAGGAKGSGGSAGTIGSDGKSGKVGNTGSEGNPGSEGIDGYNTLGENLSVVTLPYLFQNLDIYQTLYS